MALSAATKRRIVLFLATGCLACAPVGRDGEPVSISGESAIIVWDEASKTQHFIRRANFRTDAKDFGFLVPTPTVPKLEEADESAFAFLARVTAPETEWRWSDDRKHEAPKKAEAKDEVRVLETKRVAGLDAAVLQATDASALDGWLKRHGYHSSPALLEWFKPYIAQKWTITAFKLAKDAQGQAKASAVRMSFTTERPFFPYREPKKVDDDKYAYRPFTVFFAGPARVEGRVGNADWSGNTVWSAPLTAEDDAALFKLLRIARPATAGPLRLTEFSEMFGREGTDDLFFSASKSQDIIKRPPEVRSIPGFITMILVMAAIAAAVLAWPVMAIWRRLRRMRART